MPQNKGKCEALSHTQTKNVGIWCLSSWQARKLLRACLSISCCADPLVQDILCVPLTPLTQTIQAWPSARHTNHLGAATHSEYPSAPWLGTARDMDSVQDGLVQWEGVNRSITKGISYLMVHYTYIILLPRKCFSIEVKSKLFIRSVSSSTIPSLEMWNYEHSYKYRKFCIFDNTSKNSHVLFNSWGIFKYKVNICNIRKVNKLFHLAETHIKHPTFSTQRVGCLKAALGEQRQEGSMFDKTARRM